MSSKLIAEAIQWAKTSYNKKSEETLKSIISRWPKGTSPSSLVDKSSMLGEGKIGHIAKDKDERLYQLLREVHHGSSKGKELDLKENGQKLAWVFLQLEVSPALEYIVICRALQALLVQGRGTLH
jgi:hypothetical protein